MRKVYLDHAATTPVHPEVIAAMLPYFHNYFGNPSSVHSFGRDSRKAVDEAREKVAKAIGADPREVFFTSGGTESDNIAIQGVALARKQNGRHIITSKIEHHATLDTCHFLESQGYEVTYLPVDENGLVRVTDFEAALRPDTILASIMHANNEMGAIQPIKEMAAIARAKKVTFHTDAVQTVGSIPVDVKELGVDMLSLSAHKFYGPKGIGVLYIKKGTRVKPLYHGGSQERKYRPGTENHVGIVGLAKALELATESLKSRQAHIQVLRDKLIAGLVALPEVELNGHPTQRLPGNVNVSVRYVEGESLILSLDMQGVAVSSGSACTSGSLEPSHVLLAMGLTHEQAHGSLRLTLGIDNTQEDVDYVLSVMPGIVERLRQMSPLYNKR
ncbi:MAG: Cysteine desulfurase IscS [Firmicutes bacterium]|nr:Cysteine desulfurase IscS [candidate division NPL-UPA2 bacterium]MBT9153523.1 Cysteine desulfurase IscS [candidate division NPL-UPA2 bacterium]MBT9156896.1 Cysteine desulfurase IscS [candidate division NPL-UPA2 bacterium]